MRSSIPDWISHPALVPYSRWLARCSGDAPPSLAQLEAWTGEAAPRLPDGRALGIASAVREQSALDYERTIARDALVPVRSGSWHDAFNVLAWLAMPRTKAALNARHVAGGAASSPNARSRVRDAATLLDESGLLLACDASELVVLLRAHQWKPLFVERAHLVAEHVAAVVIGHGLLDKLRRPYRSLTAKAFVLTVPSGTLPGPGDLDAWDRGAAQLVSGSGFGVDALTPLPIAALPGWDSEGLGAALFEDTTVFRPRSR